MLIDSHYYLSWKQYSHLKDNTIRAYTNDLRKFEVFLIHYGYIGELDFNKFYYFKESDEYSPIDKGFIDEYINYLMLNLKATKHMLYDNIVSLKSFFGVLSNLNIIVSNPMKNYKNPYYERELIDRSMSIAESKRLLKTALMVDPFLRQTYLLVLLMLTTGLRNSEVTCLTRSQIDLERNIIYVDRGTKRTSQFVSMTPALAQEFSRYFSHPEYQCWEENYCNLVFFNNGRGLYLQGLNALLKTISLKAGIDRRVSAHTLRHTTAYLMQLSGIDVSIIQKQLRHKHISTTIRYLPTLTIEDK